MEKSNDLRKIQEMLDMLPQMAEDDLLKRSALRIQQNFARSNYDYCALLRPNGELMDDRTRARHGLETLQRNRDDLIAEDSQDGRRFLVNTIEFLLAALSSS